MWHMCINQSLYLSRFRCKVHFCFTPSPVPPRSPILRYLEPWVKQKRMHDTTITTSGLSKKKYTQTTPQHPSTQRNSFTAKQHWIKDILPVNEAPTWDPSVALDRSLGRSTPSRWANSPIRSYSNLTRVHIPSAAGKRKLIFPTTFEGDMTQNMPFFFRKVVVGKVLAPVTSKLPLHVPGCERRPDRVSLKKNANASLCCYTYV